ncbi:hypothetical protein [Streptomyces goshikiensis]|uniref:hypothetical protein n=1 Tax=Streptomyces goshikiensis TaxID=1942 RepID=UPI00368E4A46
MDEVTDALGSTEAQEQLSWLMDRLDELSGHHVVHTAIGLHPDEPVGVCASLFSLAVHRTAHDNPRVAVAQTALAMTGPEPRPGSTRRFLDLPSSLPCCLIAGTIATPGSGQRVFQARVATAHAESPYIVVLGLTSASLQHAEAYTDILEAVTHTVGFTEPGSGPHRAARPSRISEVLL